MTGTSAGDTFLSLRSVSRSFGGVQALDNVSLDVRAGEVHCLAGENGSGKSTLIKVIAGVIRPDAGTIQVGGRELTHLTPMASVALGIQVLYQDLSLFPNLTVAENLALNTLIEHRAWFVRRPTVQALARQAIAPLGVALDLDRPVGDLAMAERQLVAIARALVQDARLVILDEPTTALTAVEVASLFAVVRRLTSRGVAVVFVSHKIREMLQISDRLTILRNGAVVQAGPAAGFDAAQVARAMTGRALRGEVGRTVRPEGPVRLAVRHVTSAQLQDVSLELRAGELLGVTGLLGAGQSGLALALAGAKPIVSGEILVDGLACRVRCIRDATRAGIVYLPDDRLLQGLFIDQSIVRNITASCLRRLETPWGLLSFRRIDQEAARWSDRLETRFASAADPVSTLSGGNQQRVVLSKYLATGPKVLILNGPTVGVDVGAKEAIHLTIRRLADAGMAVMIVSDDLVELVENCDRVLVFRQGSIVGELAGERLVEDELAARLIVRH